MKTNRIAGRPRSRPRPIVSGGAIPAQSPDEEQLFVCPDRDEVGFTPSAR